jgi:hypothetical protein
MSGVGAGFAFGDSTHCRRNHHHQKTLGRVSGTPARQGERIFRPAPFVLFGAYFIYNAWNGEKLMTKNPAFEAVCDLLERELKAERAVIRGAGHAVPRTGAPFNHRLEAFLKTVSE